MRRIGLLACLFLLNSVALAAEFDADISLNYAGHLHQPSEGVGPGFQAQAKFVHDEKQFGVRAEGRLRWNDDYGHTADWRELYLTTNLADWDVSLGLQQIVWGKADNLRVLDQVNPVDYRDFVLPDLNDYRKPVMALRGTRMINDWNVELLYLPRFVPTTFARAGTEFTIPLLDPQLLEVATSLPEQRPSHNAKNGEFGTQLSRSFEGLDLSLFMFHTRDDNPVFRQLLEFDADGNPTLSLRPEYHRQFMTGLAVARAVGNGFVLRSELTYVPDFTYMASSGTDGLLKSRTLTGLLGLDYTWRDWLLSIQASDRYISRWNNSYFVPKHSPIYTLSATGSTLGGRLESRFSLTSFTQNNDGNWLQLKTTWKPDDHWAYGAGIDWFAGPRQGLFGQFRDKDRLWLELKYRF